MYWRMVGQMFIERANLFHSSVLFLYFVSKQAPTNAIDQNHNMRRGAENSMRQHAPSASFRVAHVTHTEKKKRLFSFYIFFFDAFLNLQKKNVLFCYHSF